MLNRSTFFLKFERTSQIQLQIRKRNLFNLEINATLRVAQNLTTYFSVSW